jgi:hypothetical protein
METICSSETSVETRRTTRVISQKTILFITTAVKTSNPTGLVEIKYKGLYQNLVGSFAFHPHWSTIKLGVYKVINGPLHASLRPFDVGDVHKFSFPYSHLNNFIELCKERRLSTMELTFPDLSACTTGYRNLTNSKRTKLQRTVITSVKQEILWRTFSV